MMRGAWLALLLGLAVSAGAQAASLKPLSAAGIPALLAAPAHGERIVMLWALECRYCEPNMHELARLQRAHPGQVELVLVSTDNIGRRQEIMARLKATGMRDYPTRAYTATTPERLNFLIDPNWGGEMPRTIVIRADGSRIAMSGLLTPAQLRKITP